MFFYNQKPGDLDIYSYRFVLSHLHSLIDLLRRKLVLMGGGFIVSSNGGHPPAEAHVGGAGQLKIKFLLNKSYFV